jgi:hypothetical protein
MTLLLEHEPAADKKTDWMRYLYELSGHVQHNEPLALEEQLLQDHPVLPGEREAYEWLVEVMGDQQLKVQLDKDQYHVIPRVEREDALRQD